MRGDGMPDEGFSSADEVTPDTEASPRDRRGSGIWMQLAAVLATAMALLFVLTQCVPRVPDVVGLSQEQASARLRNAGYQVGSVAKVVDAKTPVGQVAQQTPAAGAIFANGRSVDLVVTLGADIVVVPDLMGVDTPAASVQLSAKQLSMQVAGQYNPTIPAGAVMGQKPAAGTKVRVESEVVLVVSLGIEPETGGASGASSGSGSYYASAGSGGSSAAAVSGPGSECTASYPNAEVWASGGDIFIRLTPGAGARRLTNGGGWDRGPILAPNGKHVVFLRAPSSSANPTGVGRVCLTDFAVDMLDMPARPPLSPQTVTYGPPAFAPSPTGTAPESDWLVTPQYPSADPSADPDAPAGPGRLLVTDVAAGSTWTSKNVLFTVRPGTKLSESSKPGCIKVSLPNNGGVRHFSVYTGQYLR
jgi:hypothetical protein